VKAANAGTGEATHQITVFELAIRS
jgi:hypothetical protein